MVKRSDSLLFEHAIKQFSPDVFLHPVWARFANLDGPRMREMIQPLLQMEKQMLSSGDFLDACDLLFLCAAMNCRLGNATEALAGIEQIIKFGKRRHNAIIVVWGYWGAAAVCVQQRAFYPAAAYLRSLQTILERSGDWLLFDLLDMLCQSLIRQADERPGTGLNWLLPADPSLQTIFRAMLEWGETPRGMDLVYSEDWRDQAQEDIRLRWQHGWRKLMHWARSRWAAVTRLFRPATTYGLLPLHQPFYLPAGEPVPAPMTAATTAEPATTLQGEAPSAPAAQEVPSARDVPLAHEGPSANSANGSGEQAASAMLLPAPPAIPVTGPAGMHAQVRVKEPEHQTPGQPSMAFYFLGAFRLYLNDQFISDYPSQKSLSILKYLAANRGKPVAKDILKEQFWADAEAEYARRNLHQAIYALRQALKRSGSDFPYILFENDCYLFNPDLELWLDFETFENHYRLAQRLEEAAKLPEAITEYSLAEELYQGDFLEDDLYEDWPNAQRVYLRTAYLEGLSRLSEYYITQKQYAPAILLCQKTLTRDNCSEQAYRCLIRCYLAQGQRQLAMRQYQTCVQTLKKELNLAPSTETHELYQQIVSAR